MPGKIEEAGKVSPAAAAGTAVPETWQGNKWQHPPSFYCPISQQCMHDPVVLADGHSYERRHIERWLEGHDTSPVSGLRLPQLAIFPNHALRNAIEEYFQQVFSEHRRAIRRTMGWPEDGQRVSSNTSLIHTIDALMQCSLLMNADLSTECVLRRIMEEAKTLLGAEVASVFLLDATRQELYSTVNSTGGELRIPVAVGIAGHVARSGEPLVIDSAYHDSRFDKTVDVKTGFKTRSIMCAPLKAGRSGVLGVVQLINKIGSGGDSPPGGFTADDRQFLQVFASQAAAAIANSGVFDLPRGHAANPAAEHRSGPPGIGLASRANRAGASAPSGETAKGLGEGEAAGKPDMAEEKSAPQAKGRNEARVSELLEQAGNGWQFDALALADATGNRPLSTLGPHLFRQSGLVEEFGLSQERVSHFFEALEAGYDDGRRAAYHNRAHAASVLQALHALLEHGGLLAAATPALAAGAGAGAGAPARGRGPGRGQLERMACLIAAAVHDYEHKGVSNDFLVKTGDERAVRYNDQHVNEHHHVAAAFSVLLRPENNFLSHLPAGDFQRLRRLVIELVLGTDMAESGRIMCTFGETLDTYFGKAARPASGGPAGDGGSPDASDSQAAFVPATTKEAVLLLQVAMKCADLGHLTLNWDKHTQWVQRLEEEFFAQGDREKELDLPVSFLMDRCKPGASATQVGFLEGVALPLFRALARAAPRAGHPLAGVLENLRRWRELAGAGAAGPAPPAAAPAPAAQTPMAAAAAPPATAAEGPGDGPPAGAGPARAGARRSSAAPAKAAAAAAGSKRGPGAGGPSAGRRRGGLVRQGTAKRRSAGRPHAPGPGLPKL